MPGANVVITPADADDATMGHQVNLELGENTISAIVASSDGTTITHVHGDGDPRLRRRTLTELELSGVTLTPAFSADVTSYAGSVADNVASTIVTAKAVAGAMVERLMPLERPARRSRSIRAPTPSTWW